MHYTLHGGADPDGCLQTLLLRMSPLLWSAALDLVEAHMTGEHGTMVGRMPASRQWLPGAKRDTGSGAPVYSLDVPYTHDATLIPVARSQTGGPHRAAAALRPFPLRLRG